MATFQQRRDPLRLMWRRLFAALLLIVLAIVVRGSWGVYLKSGESRTLKIEAEASLNDLQSREKELRTDIAKLKSDRGIEAELREKYDLAKEGESVVVIVDPPAPTKEPQPTSLEKLKRWLFW